MIGAQGITGAASITGPTGITGGPTVVPLLVPKPVPPQVADLRGLPALMPFTRPEHKRWVGWKYEWVQKPRGDGKWTKVPYRLDGRKAANNRPAEWSRYEEVWERYLSGRFDGIGMMLLGLDGFGAIDLDDVRDRETGALLPWAEGVVRCGSYCEVTPSLEGVRVLGDWTGGKVHRNGPHPHGAKFELFSNCERFITFTGMSPDGTCWGDIDGTFGELLALLEKKVANGHDVEIVTSIDVETLPDDVGELIKDGTVDGEKVRSRGPKFMSVIRALKQRGHGFESVLALLGAHPGGVQSKYLAKGRLDKELRRAWEKIAVVPANLPAIVVEGGSRPKNADAGIKSLRNAEVPFYRRDKSLVRVAVIEAKSADGKVVKVPTIAQVGLPALGRALGQSAYWCKRGEFGAQYQIDPPDAVVKQIAEMFDEWPFPPLLGVIGTPTLRPDGTLLVSAGYDQATGLVLVDPPPMPAIPDQPTKADAEVALKLLDALLGEFPFVYDEDKEQTAAHNPNRSVALSLLMTPIVRGIAPVVPAHLVSAPTAGTGKSYLADLASVLAVGDRCAVLAFSPDPAETEKRLIGAALEGRPIIALDNCTELVAGDFLCQVTERPLMKLRPLGTTDMKTVGNAFTVFLNGNNTVVAADMVRRIIKCSLDANIESPETRVFEHNPLADIIKNRGTYIAAVLTVCRAYVCAGYPDRLPALASFEAWSDLVRSALVWLGKCDPVDTIQELREADPARESRAKVFDAWVKQLGVEKAYQVSEVISETKPFFGGSADESIDEHKELRAALLEIAADYKDPQAISPKRLGKWLTKMQRNVSGQHKLVVDRSDQRRARWQVKRA